MSIVLYSIDIYIKNIQNNNVMHVQHTRMYVYSVYTILLNYSRAMKYILNRQEQYMNGQEQNRYYLHSK